MKAKTMRGITLNILLILVMPIMVAGQDKPQPAAQRQEGAPQPQQVKPKEDLGPTADSIRPYRSSGRDPFRKTIRPKAGRGKQQLPPHVLPFPSLDARRMEFRQQVEQARARDGAEPDPVSQYLITELQITGVFRDDRGPGAFVKAQPTGTMFFVRNGSRCYNGEVVRIGGDPSDPASANVVFREVSYLEVNGKRSTQERVVTKSPAEKK